MPVAGRVRQHQHGAERIMSVNGMGSAGVLGPIVSTFSFYACEDFHE